jgi:hypothetical protein
MSSKQLAALALAAMTLTTAGCGSSSKNGSTTTVAGAPAASTSSPVTTASTSTQASSLPPAVAVSVANGKPLTRARWIAKGDAICAELNRELQALKVKRAGELPRVLPQAAAYVRTEVVQLAKLVPPASKASDWKRFLSATLQWAEGTAKLAEFAKLGDSITVSPVAKATIALHGRLVSMAQHDGFKVCSR